ncbi:response regulator transcription factor [Hyalangium gracile]|uniref:response regulator transcription factor n=1 Tax=Hyalangium gracile TaxID=394092 RepID=UPI001CCC414B|nr:response regulator [Hyalangium gracile]
MPGRILIIEAEKTPAEPLRQALEARGFTAEVVTHTDGLMQRISQEPPALVVLAVDLAEGQNGYLLCGKMKKDAALQRIPIIITGKPDGFDAHRKLKARADAYVARPVAPDALVEVAEQLLRGAPGEPQPSKRASSREPPPPERSQTEPGLLWGGIGAALALAAALAAGWFLLR